jgi:hypothetical protein
MDTRTCLRAHKEGAWYAMWQHEDGQPNHYRMYCFACDKERTFWIRPRTVTSAQSPEPVVKLTPQDHPGRGSP